MFVLFFVSIYLKLFDITVFTGWCCICMFVYSARTQSLLIHRFVVQSADCKVLVVHSNGLVTLSWLFLESLGMILTLSFILLITAYDDILCIVCDGWEVCTTTLFCVTMVLDSYENSLKPVTPPSVRAWTMDMSIVWAALNLRSHRWFG